MAAGEAAVRVVGRIGQVGALIGAVTLTALIIALVAWQKRRVARKSARRGLDRSSASNGTA
jgi:purine-nucleoside phosphorylase